MLPEDNPEKDIIFCFKQSLKSNDMSIYQQFKDKLNYEELNNYISYLTEIFYSDDVNIQTCNWFVDNILNKNSYSNFNKIEKFYTVISSCNSEKVRWFVKKFHISEKDVDKYKILYLTCPFGNLEYCEELCKMFNITASCLNMTEKEYYEIQIASKFYFKNEEIVLWLENKLCPNLTKSNTVTPI